jgi:hypothetical protein
MTSPPAVVSPGAVPRPGPAKLKLLHLIYGVLKSGKPFDPAAAMAT